MHVGRSIRKRLTCQLTCKVLIVKTLLNSSEYQQSEILAHMIRQQCYIVSGYKKHITFIDSNQLIIAVIVTISKQNGYKHYHATVHEKNASKRKMEAGSMRSACE